MIYRGDTQRKGSETAFNWSIAEELGSRLDGWDTPEMNLNPSELWEAMAFGIGSILDSWGNRDMDIGAF